MAEDPKIVPDPPPAALVAVTDPVPDRPPAPPERPPDVLTDPPPWAPRDINVVDDGPPWAPVDVAVLTDGPPAGTVPVIVNDDPPPAGTVPVAVTDDGPPWVPIVPPISPDASPGPVVPVMTDPETPMPPMWPTHIHGFPSGFPPDPTSDPPPIEPDPRDHRGTPAYEPPPVPTAKSIAAAAARFDRQLSELLLDGIGATDNIVEGALPYSRALDPDFLFRWYQDMLGLQSAQISSGVGVSTLAAKFVAEQTILYAMNDTVAKIFDPMYFVAMLVPGSMGRYTPALDVEFNNNTTVAQAKDREIVAVALFADDPDSNAFGPHNPASRGLDFTIGDLVDQALDGDTSGFLTASPADGGALRFDATMYFDPGPPGTSGPRSVVSRLVKTQVTSGETLPDSKLERAAGADGILRTRILGEGADGSVLSDTQDPSSIIDDDDAYVPLSFTDLRTGPMAWHQGFGISKTFRTVYFQAMNLRFNVAYSPDYSDLTAFGRVDPVMGYVRTGRTVNLGWEVHAFVPEDLENMYNKMTWLSSMVYPTYGQDGLFQSGPVIRLRIGDVVASDLGGTPGVIKSLSFDFGDCLWELKKGMKVPRSYAVQVDFQVLHDGPVGILDGSFGVLNLPTVGDQPQPDRNLAPKGQAAGKVPGRFMRFGEPVRKG